MKKNIQTKMQKNIKDVPHFGSVAHLNLLISLFLILLTSTAHSQSFTVFDIDTSDFPIMRAKFLAFDENGEQIKNISLNEIIVTEDGVQREVLSISCPETKPVAISSVITTDISGSMSGNPIEFAKAGTKAWIKGLPKGKFECALTTFNDGNFMVQEFTNDKQKLLSQVDSYNAGGGTNYNAAMLDPLFGGLLVTDNSQYKKVLVVVSDGMPNFETNTQQIINMANQKGVVVYSVTLGFKCPDNLKQISEQTGGKWFENITSEDEAREIYLRILNHAQNAEPCTIEWESNYYCSKKKVNVKYQYNFFEAIQKYKIPKKGVIELLFEPNMVFYDEPEVEENEIKKILVTAKNYNFVVTDIEMNNLNFDIEPKSFSLEKDESIELTVSYTAPEKGFAYCKFKFINSSCNEIFYATANHKDSPPIENTLRLTHPIGGEKFLAGSDTIIAWEGIPETETVKIDFSYNKGLSWQTLSNSSIGLKFYWNNLPKKSSEDCFVRIRQMKSVFEKFEPHGIEWEKSYGGSHHENAYSIQQTSDSGYILAGYTYSDDGDVTENKGMRDCWILKLDENGNLEWEKSYGGSHHENAYSIQQTSDSGYILAGYTYSDDGDVTENKGMRDCWILKLDEKGNIEWEKSYGGSDTEVANSIQQTSDRGYILAGYTFSNNGDISENKGMSDLWVLKLDEKGNIEWEKSYGGSDTEGANSIQQTSDSGYIVLGNTRSTDDDISENKGMYDLWVLKLDEKGNIEWEKSYGGSDTEGANSIQQTSDSGYILAGYTSSNDGDISENKGMGDLWVLKLDENGNLEWEKSYGGDIYDVVQSIRQTPNAGYIIAGRTYSNNGDISKNKGGTDFWILKLDITGNLVWEHTYGGSEDDDVFSINQTYDDGYICTGLTYSNDGDVSKNYGSSDIWVVKLYPDDEPYIQADSSDLFEIVEPRITSKEVDMKYVEMGGFRDSVVVEFIINQEPDFPVRIDSMYFEGANPDDFSFFTDAFPFKIPKGSAKKMYFRFQPTDIGYREANVVIITQADTLKYKIYGNSLQPELLVLEDVIDFGKVKLGDFRDTLQAVTIKNTGNSPMEILNTKHNLPNATDFTTLAGGGNFNMQPGDTCKMDLRFTANEIGMTSGTLEFHYDGPGSPAIIQLIADVYANPIIESTVIDNPQLLCETYEIIDIPIYNSGDDNLEISNANISGANADEFFIYPEFSFKRIYVDNWDTLQVLFKPHSTGDKSAQLNLTNNSENAQNFVINLNARKDSSGVELNTQNILFEIKDEFISEIKQIELKNTGTTDLNWTEPVQLNEFTLQNITPNPTPAGETSTADIVFAGASEGIYNETFTFMDDCGRTYSLDVKAQVGDPSLANATLQILNLEGKPGDEVNAEIYFNKGGNLIIAGVTGFSATLTFNPTLLDPMDYNMEFIDEHTAKIRIDDIPLSGHAGDVLKNVRFKVGLGNAEECDLILSDAEANGGNAQIDLISGKFKLLGVCYEGGTRLLNPYSEVGIQSISPNPAEGEIEIEVSLIESGWTELSIYNTLGEKVETILSESIENFGERTIKAKVSDYSSGLYFIVLKTPTVYQSKQVMIMR